MSATNYIKNLVFTMYFRGRYITLYVYDYQGKDIDTTKELLDQSAGRGAFVSMKPSEGGDIRVRNFALECTVCILWKTNFGTKCPWDKMYRCQKYNFIRYSKFKINSVPVSVALVSNGSLCPQFLQQG